MLDKEKTEVIVKEFSEAKKLLHAMFGKKIRYVLLTDYVTDFTMPVKDTNRFDIYLTTMRITNTKKLNILGGALHEAAHVIFSKEFAENKDHALSQKLNLVEDIFVNHRMSLKYRGASKLINETYDVENPDNPGSPWEALLALNQTLTQQGISWDYIATHLNSFYNDIEAWLNACLETNTYKERVPHHKALLDKFHKELGQDSLPNDVFGAISMLLGGSITHQCEGISNQKTDIEHSMPTILINAAIKEAQDKIEKQEEAKSKGFTPVDYIQIAVAEPDIRSSNMQWRLQFNNVAYKKVLEKSAYNHGVMSGSLSKKKIHNFGLVTHGLNRPLFKRRELGEIANFFILLDGSGSMQDYEDYVKQIVSSLVAALNERYEVIGGIFQDNVLYVSYGGLPKVSFRGGTPALAAVNAAIENMKRMKGERYLIFISDFEFSDDHPVIPNKIKFIKVATGELEHHWEYHCILNELPNKIGKMIANA